MQGSLNYLSDFMELGNGKLPSVGRLELLPPQNPDAPSSLKLLKPYQEEGVNHILNNKGTALFFKPGLGKTLTCIKAIEKLNHDNFKCLVVSKKRLLSLVWKKQIEEETELTTEIITPENIRDVLQSQSKIKIVNYDILHRLPLSCFSKWDIIIFDESSAIRNPKSQRTKAAISLSERFKKRVILTGTPVPNGAEALWAQVFVLDFGKSLGTNFFAFRRKYFRNIAKPWSRYAIYELMPGSFELISKAINHLSIWTDHIAAGSQQELKVEKVPVLLPKDAIDMSNAVLKSLVLNNKNRKDTIKNSGVAFNKALQIASGCVYNDAGDTEYIHSAKVAALSKLLKSQKEKGRSTLITFVHSHSISVILKACPNARIITGKTSDKEHAEIETEWNKKNIEVLAAQIQTVSHGLNMQYGGQDIIIFAQTPDLELYEQVIHRLFGRLGSTKPVTVYHLLATGTLDDKVFSYLTSKTRKQKRFFDYYLQGGF